MMKKGNSPKAVAANIKMEMAAGKPKGQAIAMAMTEKAKTPKVEKLKDATKQVVKAAAIMATPTPKPKSKK
jgi:hypothetical protein